MRVYAIKYTRTNSGHNRAYFYSYLSERWLPIALKAAEALILAGEGVIYEPAEGKE